MIAVRKSDDRGQADWGWLKSRHSFSFGDYYDPRYLGFRDLRVINEDLIEPGRGFDTHPHRDMEIITYVYEGMILHRDSLGNRGMVRAGEIQRMSAGTGISHSEHNGSVVEPLRLLQIWIHPSETGLAPSYQQMTVSGPGREGVLKLIVSPDGRHGSLRIHQDACIYNTVQEPRHLIDHPLARNRHGWIQLVRGAIVVNGQDMTAGDGAAVSGERFLEVTARVPSEWLFFDIH